ncbi:hypothetical protein C5167_026400 [Papaver somniferum]|nr:hypothetical protein C5167_026400 [Papaver somniferum]
MVDNISPDSIQFVFDYEGRSNVVDSDVKLGSFLSLCIVKELSFLEIHLFERVPLRDPDFVREPTMSEFCLVPDPSRDQLVIPRHFPSSNIMSEFRLAPYPSRGQLVIPRHLPRNSKVTRTPAITELLLGKGNSSCQSPIPLSQELASSQDIPMSQERAFNGKLAIKRSCKAAEWEFIIKGVGQDFYGGRDEARLVVDKYNHFFWSQSQSLQEQSRTVYGGVFLQGAIYLRLDVPCNSEDFQCEGSFIPQNPNKKVRDIVREFKSDYGLELSYDQAHAGKKLFLKELYGEDTKSYTDLVWWCEAVKKHDPGSRADLVIEGGQFKSLFLAFDACILGFEYCRPVLFLDATFLTGKFRGCLMAATGKNANNGIFPLAYGIVSGETIES